MCTYHFYTRVLYLLQKAFGGDLCIIYACFNVRLFLAATLIVKSAAMSEVLDGLARYLIAGKKIKAALLLGLESEKG